MRKVMLLAMVMGLASGCAGLTEDSTEALVSGSQIAPEVSADGAPVSVVYETVQAASYRPDMIGTVAAADWGPGVWRYRADKLNIGITIPIPVKVGDWISGWGVQSFKGSDGSVTMTVGLTDTVSATNVHTILGAVPRSSAPAPGGLFLSPGVMAPVQAVSGHSYALRFFDTSTGGPSITADWLGDAVIGIAPAWAVGSGSPPTIPTPPAS